jgi:hypothetical protein
MRRSRVLALTAATTLLAASMTIADAMSATAAGGTFGTGTPEFVNSAAPSNIDKGLFANVDFAGEPSIGVDWKSGAALFQASNSTYKVTFDNTATPPAVSWSDVSSPFSQFNVDPILATDSATGATLAGGDDGPCAVMSLTHDDGASWTPSAPCPMTADHPTVGLGPASAGSPTVTGEVGYFCQQTAVDECSHSLDGGTTWSPGVTDPNLTCLSLHGHVKIGPDGTAYVPSSNCVDAAGNLAVGAFTSSDNGFTWSGYGIPNAPTPPDGFDPSIGIDKGNRVYESWSAKQPNGDYHPVITWSDDHGKTWAPQVDLASTVPSGLGAATFEAVVAGDAGAGTSTGRAAVAYLASPDSTNGKDPFTTGYVGHWYLYVSYTFDSGATWQTVQATPDPVQIGEIDAGGTTTGGQRNLLDFMDASLTKDGRVVVAYADGCLNACNSVAQSQDEWATVAYQSAGEGLFASGNGAAAATTTTSTTAPALSSPIRLRSH